MLWFLHNAVGQGGGLPSGGGWREFDTLLLGADVINRLFHNWIRSCGTISLTSLCYSRKGKHPYWLKLVKWFATLNESALQKFVYDIDFRQACSTNKTILYLMSTIVGIASFYVIILGWCECLVAKEFDLRIERPGFDFVQTCWTDDGHIITSLKKWANPGLFSFIFGLFKQTIQIFITNICEKMSIQYLAPGFKPTTFGTWVSSHDH